MWASVKWPVGTAEEEILQEGTGGTRNLERCRLRREQRSRGCCSAHVSPLCPFTSEPAPLGSFPQGPAGREHLRQLLQLEAPEEGARESILLDALYESLLFAGGKGFPWAQVPQVVRFTEELLGETRGMGVLARVCAPRALLFCPCPLPPQGSSHPLLILEGEETESSGDSTLGPAPCGELARQNQ